MMEASRPANSGRAGERRSVAGRIQMALGLLSVLACALVGCGQTPETRVQSRTAKAKCKSMQVSSLVFTPGKAIPKKHSGEGRDISPPLAWSGAPANTKEFALICDDPDAPLALQAGATKKQLLEAMRGHVLAEGELIGTYERKK